MDCLLVAGEPRQQGGAEGRTRGRRHLDHQRPVHQESEQWRQPRSTPGCGRLPPSRSQPVSTYKNIHFTFSNNILRSTECKNRVWDFSEYIRPWAQKSFKKITCLAERSAREKTTTVDRFPPDLWQKYKLGKYKCTRRGFEHFKIHPFLATKLQTIGFHF